MDIFTKSQRIGEPPLTRGALNLKISGFSEQNIVSIPDIVRAIDVLPGYHLEGLREIVYSPSGVPMQANGSYPGSRKAEFIQRQRKIIFYDVGNFDLFHHVLYHEIGHFVFFLTLNSQVKKRWVTRIFPQSICITDYGRLNGSEDFAETYASYILNNDALKKLPGKYAFMRDCIFSGKPEMLKEKILG